jgi:heat shock protein HslJ
MRALILAATLAAAGCATPSGPAPPVRSLAGTSWNLTAIDDTPPVSGSQPTLELAADGRASGEASCNRFNGAWTQAGQSLTFGQMATTRRACLNPALSEQETRYLKALEGSATYRQDNGKLWVEGAGGRLAFETAGGRTVSFDCGEGRRITVVFTGDIARLTDPQGNVHDLRQQPAASGIWYEGRGQSLRGKGPEMSWSVGRMSPQACREAG